MTLEQRIKLYLSTAHVGAAGFSAIVAFYVGFHIRWLRDLR